MNAKLVINNKTQHSVPSEKDIKNAILAVFKEKGFDINAEVGLKVVGKAEIKKLNAKFRGKDTATDVLSFPIFTKAPKVSAETILLGDIVICYDVAQENADLNHISTDDEFLKLVSHSTLHLLGFHHKE